MAVDVKTRKRTASVAAFLKKAAPGARGAECKTLVAMMRKATGEPPAMWGSSIVGFGSYRYVYASGRSGDWPIAGFSPRKGHLVVYIMPGFKPYASLMKKLGKHTTGASCLYIKSLAAVDLGVLAELISASAKHMKQKYKA